MQFIVAVEKPRSYNPMIALDIFHRSNRNKFL